MSYLSPTDRETFDRIFSPWAKELDVNKLWFTERISHILKSWWSKEATHEISLEELITASGDISQWIAGIIWSFLKENWIDIPPPDLVLSKDESSGYGSGSIIIWLSDLEKLWVSFITFICIFTHELWHHILHEYAKSLNKKTPESSVQEEFCDYLVWYIFSHINWVQAKEVSIAEDFFEQIWYITEIEHLKNYGLSPISNEMKVHSNNVHWLSFQRAKRFTDGFELWEFWLQLKLMQCFMKNRHLK